jgi:Cu+-exporting ATPase
VNNRSTCFHCGEDCPDVPYHIGEKSFCCEGCKLVFQLLNENGLCDYYDLNANPGRHQRIKVRKDKFAYLDDEKIAQRLIRFRQENEVHTTFYLPHIHCSSCLYLLENLHRLNPGISRSQVNFTKKEATIIFDEKQVSLREIAEILTSIGYEPYISLTDLNGKKPGLTKTMIYQLGVAGFCFANIMLLSFPDYLGLEEDTPLFNTAFRYLSLILALPVLVFSAMPFYTSSFKALKMRFLNIDAPIVLAIWVTFGRSLYEVLTGTGTGYFDSFSGIVFFMLVGRVLQDKTYQQLSFDRDYSSYFPIAVTRLKHEKEESVSLPDIVPGDTLLLHNEELVPADSILTRGKAFIDYSFVTGESVPVLKEVGEIIYAGGKQVGSNIELLVIREVSQSYLTGLWNRNGNVTRERRSSSFVHQISTWFTYIVFAIAIVTAGFWAYADPAKIWTSVTAILIVACPCALLLSNTFTNGFILRILGRNNLYLRNAEVIEEVATVDHIVFDKTGTLTTTDQHRIDYKGRSLSAQEQQAIASLAAQSLHPLSKAIAAHLGKERISVKAFEEKAGHGIEGIVNDDLYAIGSAKYITGRKYAGTDTNVFISKENQLVGRFRFRNQYRETVPTLLDELKGKYNVTILSGDNAGERASLRIMTAPGTELLFDQQPQDKLNYIRKLRREGHRVMMVGDGLNDGVALLESNIGIAVSESSNAFTPASEAILEGKQLGKLHSFIRFCKSNRKIVMASFIMSILYNITGLFFAVQGLLSPMIAAILMPASSISIILLSACTVHITARKLGLTN